MKKKNASGTDIGSSMQFKCKSHIFNRTQVQQITQNKSLQKTTIENSSKQEDHSMCVVMIYSWRHWGKL